MNSCVSFIISSVGLSYELVQDLIVWNINAMHVGLPLAGCAYR